MVLMGRCVKFEEYIINKEYNSYYLLVSFTVADPGFPVGGWTSKEGVDSRGGYVL